ncbi:MAG: DUF4124 domain-containing protein [Panacagrimonas sp.]
MRSLVALALILLATAIDGVAGEVYRYVDKDGVVHYTDRPPTPDSEPIKLRPVQTIGIPAPPAAASAKTTPATSSPKIGIIIVSPAADETLRGDDGILAVSVRLDPPLPEGVGLRFLLDGNAQNTEATRSLSHHFQGVERGSHLVGVSAVDAAGHELGRAAPVLVHMKPPTVDQAPRVPRPGTP